MPDPATLNAITDASLDRYRDSFATEVTRLVNKRLRFLMRHRERYVKAWIAATGIDPRECELVEQQTMEGEVRVWIRRRRPEMEL